MALCEQTFAAVLFNLGILLEVRCHVLYLHFMMVHGHGVQMGGKVDGARISFEESLDQAKRIGLRSAAMEARGALRRLDRIVGVQPGGVS